MPKAIQDPHIYPTHHCFDDALDFIIEVLKANPQDRDALLERLFLVHGLCQAPDGHPYAHAWVEDSRKTACIFRGIVDGETHYFAAAKDEYYADAKVLEVTQYSVQEALEQNRRHGTFGPWEPRYIALAR